MYVRLLNEREVLPSSSVAEMYLNIYEAAISHARKTGYTVK